MLTLKFLQGQFDRRDVGQSLFFLLSAKYVSRPRKSDAYEDSYDRHNYQQLNQSKPKASYLGRS
jgi:hypothetical protein